MQIDCEKTINSKRMDTPMQTFDINEVSKHVGLFLSISAGLGVIVKLLCWIKKKIEERRAKRDYMKNMLEQIAREQIGIRKTLMDMDSERHQARAEDAQVRTTLYLGTVAIVDAIMRLAEHEGLKINGEVAAYRKANIDNLKNGVGIKPLHALEDRED